MKSGILVIAVLAVAVLSYAAYAQSGPSMVIPVVVQPNTTNVTPNATGNIVTKAAFQAAVSQVACKTNFTVSFINEMVNEGITSLSQYATTLQQDQSQLQAFADSGDVGGYRAFLKGTYDADFAQARDAVQSQIRASNLSTKLSLRNSWQQLKASFESCSLGVLRTYAQNKVDTYTKLLSDYQQRANDFGNRTGVDISSLTQIIGNANTQIVQPMQAAINAATDSASLKDAVKGYCLFNGCNGGLNYHLAARYEEQRLSLLLGLIQNKANTTGLETQISQAQGYLNSAISMIKNPELSAAQEKQLWGYIQSATQAIRGIISSLTSFK